MLICVGLVLPDEDGEGANRVTVGGELALGAWPPPLPLVLRWFIFLPPAWVETDTRLGLRRHEEGVSE